MVDNVVTALLRPGGVTTTRPLFQYNQGMILRLTGTELPDTFRADFALNNTQESKPVLGHGNEVEIPYEYFVPGSMINCWIVVNGTDYTVTKYHIVIPVEQRARPGDEEPTPEEQTIIDQAIAALNDGVQRAEAAADGIEQTVADALTEAKESGEFDGPKGDPGAVYTPTVSAEGVISWSNNGGLPNPESRNIKGQAGQDGADGHDGAPGQDGTDGFSPTVTIASITGGHSVTITDVDHPNGQSFDVMDGTDGQTGQTGPSGDDGYSPTASVSKSGSTATITITDKNGTTTATVSDGVNGSNGQDGLPGADGYSPTASVTKSGSTATITITDKNGTTTATVSDGQNGTDGQTGPAGPGVASGGTQGQMLVKKSGTDYDTEWANQPSVPVQDVQVNGTSVVSGGVANVPLATPTVPGVVTSGTITITGTTPSITALPGIQYVCGEVTTLDITLPASGCVDVVFESGSTPTLLTVTPPTGVTVKWANGFDPTALEANTTYEINIADGLGVTGSWT